MFDETTWSNLGTIAQAEVMRAHLHPGKTFGKALHPYVRTTVRMEPSGMFILSRPDGDVRPPNDMAAILNLGMAWQSELRILAEKDRGRFDKAAALINGKALEEAKSLLAPRH